MAVKRTLLYVLKQERFLDLTRARRMYNSSDTIQDGDVVVTL